MWYDLSMPDIATPESAIPIDNLGYQTSIEKDTKGKNFARLKIRLGPPTYDSFDPDKIQLRTVDSDGESINNTNLGAKSREAYVGNFRIAPGLITLFDRKGKKTQFYCFGGNGHLEEDKSTNEIPYLFVDSTAPIFIVDDSLLGRLKTIMLSDECEAYLGKTPPGNQKIMSAELKANDPVKLYKTTVELSKQTLNRRAYRTNLNERIFIFKAEQEIAKDNTVILPSEEITPEDTANYLNRPKND